MTMHHIDNSAARLFYHVETFADVLKMSTRFFYGHQWFEEPSVSVSLGLNGTRIDKTFPLSKVKGREQEAAKGLVQEVYAELKDRKPDYTGYGD